MKTIYGPVPSWRLGRSLGVDVICRKEKVCSFDCVYCQLGKTFNKTIRRTEFIDLGILREDLTNAISKINADVVTLSGMGEPTLASNLKDAIELISQYTDLPLAILTNSSLMYEKDVSDALKKLDIVVAKLDAPNQQLFQKINRPTEEISYKDVINGIKQFRNDFKGKLAIQIMFIKENEDYAEEMANTVRGLNPDEVQVNTPLRPSPVKPLSSERIESIMKHFNELNAISVYRSEKPKVEVIDKTELLRRRRIEDD